MFFVGMGVMVIAGGEPEIVDAQFRAKPNVTATWLVGGWIGAAIEQSTAKKASFNHITLFSVDGRKIRVTPSFPQILEVMEFVILEVPPRRAKKILDDISIGQEARYGKLHITGTGIRVGRKEMGWDEIKSHEMKGSEVKFTMLFHSDRNPKPLKFAFGDHVANVFICEVLEARSRRAGLMAKRACRRGR